MNRQEYLLTCCAEEGVEIAVELLSIVQNISKIASKCNRFGHDNIRPSVPDGPTNVERLVDELNDMIVVANLLADVGVIPKDWNSKEKQQAKLDKINSLNVPGTPPCKLVAVRQHRGSYDDSMATVSVIPRNLTALVHHINSKMHGMPVTLLESDLSVTRYSGIDSRNGWDTYIIVINGYGVFGFCDGPIT